MKDFIFFEESWNGNWERKIQQGGTGTTREEKNDTESSRESIQIHKKDKA